jgi:hypothetical protein
MIDLKRVVGLVLVSAALWACTANEGLDQPGTARSQACRAGGVQCRWDNQCCSGRCSVDLGCNG